MKEFDVNAIIDKARELDETAMGELYRHYQPKIFKFIYYRTGVEKADDLTSDVFVKVLRSISKQRGNFEAWLYKIARNVIIDKARYVNRRPEVAIEQEQLENIQEPKTVQSKFDDASSLQYALSLVNDEQREFLTLKFIQGLDNKEIAAITGKKIGALRALQFRSLKAISEAGEE